MSAIYSEHTVFPPLNQSFNIDVIVIAIYKVAASFRKRFSIGDCKDFCFQIAINLHSTPASYCILAQ